jgi:hypothetical protein
MCKNMWARGRRFFLAGTNLGHRRATMPYSLTKCGLARAPPSSSNFFFGFKKKILGIFEEVWGWAWHFGKVGL